MILESAIVQELKQKFGRNAKCGQTTYLQKHEFLLEEMTLVIDLFSLIGWMEEDGHWKDEIPSRSSTETSEKELNSKVGPVDRTIEQ